MGFIVVYVYLSAGKVNKTPKSHKLYGTQQTFHPN